MARDCDRDLSPSGSHRSDRHITVLFDARNMQRRLTRGGYEFILGMRFPLRIVGASATRSIAHDPGALQPDALDTLEAACRLRGAGSLRRLRPRDSSASPHDLSRDTACAAEVRPSTGSASARCATTRARSSSGRCGSDWRPRAQSAGLFALRQREARNRRRAAPVRMTALRSRRTLFAIYRAVAVEGLERSLRDGGPGTTESAGPPRRSAATRALSFSAASRLTSSKRNA